MKTGRSLYPPTQPDHNDSLRSWISFRTRSEIFEFLSRANISVRELAEMIGINENTFRTLQQGTRERNPTAEVLHKLDEINFMSEFNDVPKRDGKHIDVFYIITGRRDTFAIQLSKQLKEKIKELQSQLSESEANVATLKKTIRLING